ncbi:Oidioi.mRNA.OKI2018_I69.chr2.g7259.t1.cds [Oikopleura dioica]|uniref:Oidioi.mRNA.OKI2018_I69.chr2.g7259.t1.cds n=1 Tax=Oikopleura dioica TaxID=34765 RepID=A0ABN7T621_OIKDI|nr:Oidioi.mRNA.OKI2018_I69.chr2.g7259.t1.cds [Oikopleura dioica]
MKIVSCFLSFALALPQCPRLWNAEWENGMEKIFSNAIIGTSFVPEGGFQCYPSINKIECNPPLDEVAGEYPYQHVCQLKYTGSSSEFPCFIDVPVKQYNTYYQIDQVPLQKGFPVDYCSSFGRA